MNETHPQPSQIDDLDDALAPLWQAVDQLEADWRTHILAQLVDDGSALLREATDMALAVIENQAGDIDDARGALANQLKALLDDARFVRLRPSVAFAKSGPDNIWADLTLPEALRVPLDSSALTVQSEDAFDDRVYKVWRRFVRHMSDVPRQLGNRVRRWRQHPERDLPEAFQTVRVQDIGQTQLQTELPMEAALVHGFEVSTLTVQALRRLWQVFLKEYTALDERAADCEALEQVCADAQQALMERGAMAENEIASSFETLRTALRDSLTRIDAPWNVYVRAVNLYLGKLRLHKRYQDLEDNWERLYRGMLGSFDLGLEIASFQYQATEYGEQVQELVAQHLEHTLVDPLSWMRDRCKEVVEGARTSFADFKKNMADQDEAAFRQAIEGLQDKLEGLVTHLSTGYTIHTLGHIDSGYAGVNERKELSLMSDASEQLMRHVGGDCDFWVGEPPEWSVGEPPPDTETLRVPVREMVRPLVENDMQLKLDELHQRVIDLFLHAQNVLQDIWKVIRFNVESGIAEMDSGGTDRAQVLDIAEEIVVGGLARAGGRVGALVEEVEKEIQDIDTGISEVVREGIDKVEKSLQPGSGLDVRLRQFTRLAKSRAEGYAEFGEGVGAALLGRLRRGRQWTGNKGGLLFNNVRRRLGLVTVAQHETQSVIDEADLSNTKLERLPSIYRRLFRMVPLQTEDFLVAREDSLKIMELALKRWEAQKPSALALVGEVGTGKTTLLNCALPKLFHKYETFRHAFDETVKSEADLARVLSQVFGLSEDRSMEDLATHLNERETACVVVLEHGYELFMRRIGGLEVIRAFLQFTARTSEKVFWCLSMTESAWRYLNAVVQISGYFNYIIETRDLTGEELEKVIMTRHEVSGFGLNFGADDSPLLARRLKKAVDEGDAQRILRDVFFDRLADASKGNVQIALFYWLRAIKEIKNDVVFVDALKPLRFAFLSTLSVDKLFTLAAILQHGTLTVQEHMEIFRSSQSVSEGMLGALAANNLIQRNLSHEGTRYAINPVMRRPVVDLLWNRHIFY